MSSHVGSNSATSLVGKNFSSPRDSRGVRETSQHQPVIAKLYTNSYRCWCGNEWESTSSSLRNDHCPACGLKNVKAYIWDAAD